MIACRLISSAMVRGILVAAVAMVGAAVVGSAGGTARAPTSSAPALDAPRTTPRDERQPRRLHLPSNVRQQESSELSSERTFDQQLRICGAC